MILTSEHGVTFAAFDAGAFSLNTSVAMTTKDASVGASQTVVRSSLSLDAANRSVSSRNAFIDATQLLVQNTMESISRYTELGILYGQSGIGVTASSANASTTSTVITLTTASWASGIWAGSENERLQFFKQSDGSLVSSGADSIFTITSVDDDNKKITVSGTTTGIAALDTAIAAGALDIYLNGARTDATTFNEMVGLNKIITNTGSLFGIDAASFNLWKGNTFSASSAALTLAKLLSAIQRAVSRGGLNEKVDVWMSPRTWSNLLNDQAALRHYDTSYSKNKLDNGSQSLTFYSMNGAMELQAHPMVKEGEAFIIPMKRVKRLGATDITFKDPEGDEVFHRLENVAAYELRAHTDQAVLLESPAKACKITSIVNS